MYIGPALQPTSHAIHVGRPNKIHVIELPDGLTRTYHQLGYFDSSVPMDDVSIMVTCGQGKTSMDRRKMPLEFLSQLGIDPNTVLHVWISAGSGVMATLSSQGLLDDKWLPARH